MSEKVDDTMVDIGEAQPEKIEGESQAGGGESSNEISGDSTINIGQETSDMEQIERLPNTSTENQDNMSTTAFGGIKTPDSRVEEETLLHNPFSRNHARVQGNSRSLPDYYHHQYFYPPNLNHNQHNPSLSKGKSKQQLQPPSTPPIPPNPSIPTTTIDHLTTLPDELLLNILTSLDIPDLTSLLKVSRRFRILVHDPLLHKNRLLSAKEKLRRGITERPTLESLLRVRIYLSGRDVATRDLGRALVKIKLGRRLERRPEWGWLVERGVVRGVGVGGCSGRGGSSATSSAGGVGCASGSSGNGSSRGRGGGCLKVVKTLDTAPSSILGFMETERRGSSLSGEGNTEHIQTLPATLSLQSSSPTQQQHHQQQQQQPQQKHATQTLTIPISPTLLQTCLVLEKHMIRNRLTYWVTNLRPSLEHLVVRNILPKESICAGSDDQKTPYSSSANVSSSLVRPGVRYLVSRFTNRHEADGEIWRERESRWGRGVEGRRRRGRERWERVGWAEVAVGGEPARARVGGLRRFYERLQGRG